MKTYKIKNTDIQLNGKLFPEGSTINLDDKDAQSLSDYLVQSNLEPELKTNTKIKNHKRSK